MVETSSQPTSEFWWKSSTGGWATAVALLLLLVFQLLRSLSRRRPGDQNPPPTFPASPLASPSLGTSKLVTDADLKDLIISLEGATDEGEIWEDVIDKKNEQISYKAKCCRPKVGPLKYLSVTTFEECSTEVLRDFYMDNEYRIEWDKTWVQHEQLQVDETSGTEIGRTIKKFPFLTPREYILAWRVWEGKEKTFYCFTKECEHSRAPRQKKYVRVRLFRSGWYIRKVPGRDACEITVVHQEDAGLNVEMAKLAFAKGIWSYVCKMNSALREYSSRNRSRSTAVIAKLRLIQKVPPALESVSETSRPVERSPGGDSSGSRTQEKKLARKPSKKWIANGLLLAGGIFCLCRGRSALGTQIAMACLLKRLLNQEQDSGGIESSVAPARFKRQSRRKI